MLKQKIVRLKGGRFLFRHAAKRVGGICHPGEGRDRGYSCEHKRANQIYLAALGAAIYRPAPAYAGVTNFLLENL